MVALLDENSASDGDIFPWQFRNAGLGPLIGKQSWGGVVGITNHGAVIDGGSVNVPEFGFANLDGEYVIEGEGVHPDIEVDNDPASVLAGRDRQLERAIAELLSRIENDPRRFPDRPEAPVKTD
jgi:tricorn protease